MTIPERVLWHVLRNGRLGGLSFRKRHPLGPFTVDFCCLEKTLVIEIDGMSHDGQGEKDDPRTRELERLGYRVIRFTNDEVLQNSEDVAVAIARAAGLNW